MARMPRFAVDDDATGECEARIDRAALPPRCVTHEPGAAT